MAHLLLIWHDRSRVAHQQLQKKDIVGLAHLKRLFPLLEKLHHVGCGRDKAGNRDLYF